MPVTRFPPPVFLGGRYIQMPGCERRQNAINNYDYHNIYLNSDGYIWPQIARATVARVCRWPTGLCGRRDSAKTPLYRYCQCCRIRKGSHVMIENAPRAVSAAPAKLSDKVYEKLIEAIRSGEYGEDLRLPSETEMARQFDVSRPILRQALTQLREEGFVTSRKGSGWFVQRGSKSDPYEFGQLKSIDDVKKCLEFRRGIEGEAAWQAAKARKPEQIAEIERTIRAMRSAVTNGSEGIEEDFNFHIAVAQASRNRFFIIALEGLREQINFGVELLRKLSPEPMMTRIITIEEEHREILDAIKKGDPEAARSSMVRHIAKGIDRAFAPSSI